MREIEKTLGKAAALWTRLHADLCAEFGPPAEKWSYSARTEHWALQLKQQKKKRTVVYLILCPGHFLAAFALGEKACRAAQEGGLPAAVLEVIEKAPRYPEGRGVRLEVRTRKTVEDIMELARIKMAN